MKRILTALALTAALTLSLCPAASAQEREQLPARHGDRQSLRHRHRDLSGRHAHAILQHRGKDGHSGPGPGSIRL